MGMMPIDMNMFIGKLTSLLTYDQSSPMIFSSGLFLFLFLGFSLIYALLCHVDTARILFVTAFSYYFYYKSSGCYFVILALVTCFDFIMAHAINACRNRFWRAATLCMSLLFDLSFLFYFKYANFFGQTWAGVMGGNFQPMDIFLPVGISFFTFQSLSYTIDVYRRQLRPLDSLLDYAFYVSFFPQLVAGPIVRASDFIPQIRRRLTVTSEYFGEGIFLIAIGLFKKSVISDFISLNFVDRIFDNPQLYSGVECLLGVYGYAMQIYCDFSGYSDMAIGIALLLGFRFPENFNRPYLSTSITDFWRRWHISLSSWLRDYVYISLGGNRHGRMRQYLNLLITMLVGGLWHGASTTFVVWGGLHGVALACHKAFRSLLGRNRDYRSPQFFRFWGIVITFHFVCLMWVLFRSQSFDAALQLLSRIAFSFNPQLLDSVIVGYAPSLSLILLGYVLHLVPMRWQSAMQVGVGSLPLLFQALLIAIVAFIVIQVKSSDIQPFIYFQF